MSKKPEGIPEGIWSDAETLSVKVCAHAVNWTPRGKPLDELVNTEVAAMIARAILAAVEAERETCARVADSVPIGGLVETNETDLKRLWKYAGSAQAGAIASAIRNRGEG